MAGDKSRASALLPALSKLAMSKDWYRRLGATSFNLVHRCSLVYNTCWEDPRLDRAALDVGSQDSIAVITSAGCNALDYALLAPKRVFAVDINPRQNALLELKLAAVRSLGFDDFFALFGRGRFSRFPSAYREVLRASLSPAAQSYWDRRGHFFAPPDRSGSFYFRGSTGWFATAINFYIDRIARVREPIEALLAAPTTEQQQAIYDRSLRPRFWRPVLRWFLERNSTLAFLGVPPPQRACVNEAVQGGIVSFIERAVEEVFTRLPLADNYFWRVYLTGEYTENCCPEYLTRDGFHQLKAGLVDRVGVHTGSLLTFLRECSEPITRLVLLDHMDWLHLHQRNTLQAEWQAIVDRAAPGSRLLWRSAGFDSDFVDSLEVRTQGRSHRMGDRLKYHRRLAHELHQRDRVHTYGSFHIADLAA